MAFWAPAERLQRARILWLPRWEQGAEVKSRDLASQISGQIPNRTEEGADMDMDMNMGTHVNITVDV